VRWLYHAAKGKPKVTVDITDVVCSIAHGADRQQMMCLVSVTDQTTLYIITDELEIWMDLIRSVQCGTKKNLFCCRCS